ncbi:MAG: hypothetical protein CW338_09805, partial [Clostridiales bacterium]|nr:hypothetical protein [Clostridiales bacterium]
AGAAAEDTVWSLDFEDGNNSAFTNSGTCRLSVADASAIGGTRALLVSNRTVNDWDAADLRTGATPVRAGREFTYSFRVYVDADGSGPFTLGKAGGDYAYLKTETVTGRTWTLIEGTAVLDETVNLRFMTTGEAWRGRDYYIDDVVITAAEAEETSSETAGYFRYESDFSAGADGWYARSAGGAAVEVTENGLYITGRTAAWNSPGRNFPFEKGMMYKIRVQVMQDAVDSVGFILSVARTKNGTESYQNLVTVKNVKRGEWVELQADYNAGDYDSYVLYVETDSAGTIPFTISDITVKSNVIIYPSDIPSLKDTYAGLFDFGAAVSRDEAVNDGCMRFCASQFAILTPGNELKPDFVLDVGKSRTAARTDDTAVVVSFDAAKPLLDYAWKNGIRIHGHVLVWHSQTPEAFFHEGYKTSAPYVTREVMLARLENYIRLVMEYTAANYPGLIVSWDVVNEAVADSGGKLRESNWTKVVGDDFVVMAFRYARQYAPEGTLLFYNDYSTPYEPKLTGIYNLLSTLVEEGTIDGYGFQCHYGVNSPSMAQVRNAFAKIASLGLKLRVSELDVEIGGKPSAGAWKCQAQYYAGLMEIFREYAGQLIAVQVWGVTDNMSWKADKYPLLFDEDAQPKDAFWMLTDPSHLEYE